MSRIARNDDQHPGYPLHPASDPTMPFLFPVVATAILIATIVLFRIYVMPASVRPVVLPAPTGDAGAVRPLVSLTDEFTGAAERYPDLTVRLASEQVRQLSRITLEPTAARSFVALTVASGSAESADQAPWQHLYLVAPTYWAELLDRVSSECALGTVRSVRVTDTGTADGLDGRILVNLQCGTVDTAYLFTVRQGKQLFLTDIQGMIPSRFAYILRSDGGTTGSFSAAPVPDKDTVTVIVPGVGSPVIDLHSGAVVRWQTPVPPGSR